MNKLVKDALVLTAITLVSGFALGAVYEITKEPIAQANEAATQEAYRTVFPDAASFEEYGQFDAAAANEAAASAGYSDAEITATMTALDADGNLLGYVFNVVSHSGYGGDIAFSMGVTTDGVLNGYSITEISETAGLGMKANEEPFMSQFQNIPAQTLTVTKQAASSETEIEAISGATITSNAVTNGVDAGLAYYASIEGGAADE